jgi:hypothetical protein
MSRTKLLTALGVLAIAAVPVSGATAKKPPHPTHPAHPSHPAKPTPKPKKTHTVAYKAKGVVKSVDAGAKSVTVTVGTKKGDTNKASRAWSGQDVTFDLSNARVRVNHDTNGDGKRDLADVKTGDKAKILAKLARGTTGNGPFAAKKADFKTAKPTPPPPPQS